LSREQSGPDVLADGLAVEEIRAVARTGEGLPFTTDGDGVVARTVDDRVREPPAAVDPRHRSLQKVAASLDAASAGHIGGQHAREPRTYRIGHLIIIRRGARSRAGDADPTSIASDR